MKFKVTDRAYVGKNWFIIDEIEISQAGTVLKGMCTMMSGVKTYVRVPEEWCEKEAT